MTSLELTSEINHNLSLLADDEPALKKVANYIKKLLTKKADAPMDVTPELEAIIEKADKDLAEGRLKVLHNEQELQKFYDSL